MNMKAELSEDYLVEQLVIFPSSLTFQKFHTLVEPLLKKSSSTRNRLWFKEKLVIHFYFCLFLVN